MDLYVALPGINKPEKFQNWTKCVMGFNITRKALRKPIELGAKEHLRDMDRELIFHFEQFSKCLKESEIKHLKRSGQKHNRILFPCDHELCHKIFAKLIKKHAEKGKVEKQWHMKVFPKLDTSEENAALEKDKTEERDTPEKDKKVEVILENYFWDIMKLYTYNDTVKGNSEEIDKIELVLLLQILSSCEFPRFSGFKETNEKELREVRNTVMHSGDVTLDKKNLYDYIGIMIKTLQIFSNEFQDCNKAIASLNDLRTFDCFKLAKERDELHFVIEKTLISRKRAIEFDVKTCIDSEEKRELSNLLYSTRSQIRVYERKCMGNNEEEHEQSRKETNEPRAGPFQRVGRGVDYVLGWRPW